MKNRAHDIRSYAFAAGESYLFDANIWLYLSAPPSDVPLAWAKSQYSAALKKLLTAGSKLIISSTVVSEYVNRFCRIEWEVNYKAKYQKFKDFRNSSDFGTVGALAAAEVSDILAICKLGNDQFENCNTTSLLSDLSSGTADFNDGLISHFCAEHKCKLVTNDSDFTEGGLEVVTANNKLLIACPK